MKRTVLELINSKKSSLIILVESAMQQHKVVVDKGAGQSDSQGVSQPKSTFFHYMQTWFFYGENNYE